MWCSRRRVSRWTNCARSSGSSGASSSSWRSSRTASRRRPLDEFAFGQFVEHADLVTDAPDSPHRLASGLAAEVHFGISGNDMSPETLSELNRALDAAGVDYTSEIYPGTVHGFTMADTDAFNPAALQRHWDRLLALLDRTLTNG